MWLVLGIAELTVICEPCKMVKSKKIVPTFEQILHLTALFERGMINLMELQ
jgi:hypothetical protein